MNAAADAIADDFAELLEMIDAVRAAAIAAGQFYLASIGNEEVAFDDDLLDALALPASVLVVHLRVTDLEPGDPDYVHTMPLKLGRGPLDGGFGPVPDVERARKYGFTEAEIEAALERTRIAQEPRPAPRASQAAEQPPAQGTPPEQADDPFPNVIHFGSARRALHPPGIRLSDGQWSG